MATKKAITDLRVTLEATDEGMAELIASIKKLGIIRPLVVDSTGLVLDGVRRLAAAQKLGLKQVPVDVSDDFNTSMMLIEANRDGPCHLVPNHHRANRVAVDTLPQQKARTLVSRIGNAARLHGKGEYTKVVPVREALGRAIGRSTHELQAAIMLHRVANDPTHLLNTEAVKLLEAMDGGLTGSAAQQRFQLAVKSKAGNNIVGNEDQREIITNAIINMKAIADTLNRIMILDPKFTAEELWNWNKDFAPVRGALARLSNRFKQARLERSEENK